MYINILGIVYCICIMSFAVAIVFFAQNYNMLHFNKLLEHLI